MKLLFALLSIVALAQTGPSQATTGPGGTNYVCTDAQTGPFWAAGHAADDAYRYFIYQCQTLYSSVSMSGRASISGSTKLGGIPTMPIIVMFHGLNADDPATYSLWLDHMARKGYTVIWIQFQVVGVTPLADYKDIAVVTIADAISKIQNDAGYFRPYTVSGTPQTIYVGHSAGAATAMSVASLAISGGTIPVPKGYFGTNTGFDTSPASLAGIPAGFKMVFVVGNDDTTACKGGTSLIWNNTSQITDRNFLVSYSDSHGSPGLTANHIFPTTAIVNAYDYYAIWKLSVALADCTLYGTNCDYALSSGGTNQVYMGLWSDSTPVVPLGWFTSPAATTLACE